MTDSPRRYTVFASPFSLDFLIWDRQATATVDSITQGDFVRLDGQAVRYPTRADAQTITDELNADAENRPSAFDECSACGALVRLRDFSFHLEFECTDESIAANAGSAD